MQTLKVEINLASSRCCPSLSSLRTCDHLHIPDMQILRLQIESLLHIQELRHNASMSGFRFLTLLLLVWCIVFIILWRWTQIVLGVRAFLLLSWRTLGFLWFIQFLAFSHWIVSRFAHLLCLSLLDIYEISQYLFWYYLTVACLAISIWDSSLVFSWIWSLGIYDLICCLIERLEIDVIVALIRTLSGSWTFLCLRMGEGFELVYHGLLLLDLHLETLLVLSFRFSRLFYHVEERSFNWLLILRQISWLPRLFLLWFDRLLSGTLSMIRRSSLLWSSSFLSTHSLWRFHLDLFQLQFLISRKLETPVNLWLCKSFLDFLLKLN